MRMSSSSIEALINPLCAITATCVANWLGWLLLRQLAGTGQIDTTQHEILIVGVAAAPGILAIIWLWFTDARSGAWWLLFLPGILIWATRPGSGMGTVFPLMGDWIVSLIRHPRLPPADVKAFMAGSVIMAFLTLAAFARPLMAVAKQMRRGVRGAQGTTRGKLPQASWATGADVRKRFGHKGGIVLGEHTDPLRDTPAFDPGKHRTWAGRQGKGHLITMDPATGNGHVLVLAASAGYKTSGIVIPNILHYDDPIVVFDPKGDLYARTRDARREMGRDAIVIDANSGFDPFRMIVPLAREVPSVYHTMAKTLMPLAGRASDISEYFHEMSVSLFAALTAHFVEENSQNIARDISRFINRDRDSVVGEASQIAAKNKMPFVGDEMAGLAALDARTFPGVVKGIANKLAFTRYPDIATYGQSAKSPEEHLRALDPDTDIYINLPGLAARDFASFPRLLIGGMLVVSELIEQPDRPRARRLFLIDEARVLGGMDVLTNVRDAGRSIGMHLMLIYQNLGQVIEAWGGQAGADAWLDSCEARVISAVGSARSAADISNMLGKRTIRITTEGSTASNPVMTPLGGSVGSTEQEQLRDIPLLTQAALGQLPGHGSVIFTRRSKPILATKAIWFTRPDMKDRVRRAKDIEGELTVTKRREAVLDNIDALKQARGMADGPQAADPPAPPPQDRPMHAPDAGEVRGDSDQATGREEGASDAATVTDPGPDQSPDIDPSGIPDGGMVAGPIPGDPHDGDSGEDHPPMAVTQQEPVTTPGHEDEKPTQTGDLSIATAPDAEPPNSAPDSRAGNGEPVPAATDAPPQPDTDAGQEPAGTAFEDMAARLDEYDPSVTKSRAAADLFDRSRLRPVAPDDHPNIAVHLATRIRLTVDPDDPVLRINIEPYLIRLLEKAARSKPGQSARSPESLAARITSLPNLRGEALLIAEAIDRALSAPPSAGPPDPSAPTLPGLPPADSRPQAVPPATHHNAGRLPRNRDRRTPPPRGASGNADPEDEEAEPGGSQTMATPAPHPPLPPQAVAGMKTEVATNDDTIRTAHHPDDPDSVRGSLGVPLEALDFGRRHTPRNPTTLPRWLRRSWKATAPVRILWADWMQPRGQVPLNLRPWTLETIPRPHDATTGNRIVRLWDIIDWYITHPDGRYDIYARKLRQRAQNLPAWRLHRLRAHLRGQASGSPPWLRPTDDTPDHDALRTRLSPRTAHLAPTGDRYDIRANAVTVPLHNKPPETAHWTTRDISRTPREHPPHLTFEHVASPEPLDTDNDDLRQTEQIALQTAMVSGLLHLSRTPEPGSTVAAFLEHWPEIPRHHAGAAWSGLSPAPLPLKQWDACIWVDDLDGAPRLFRQPVGANGYPLGAALSWPMNGDEI